MSKFNATIFPLCCLLLLFPASNVLGNPMELFPSKLDSLPQAEKEYKGFRIHLTNIVLQKQKENKMSLGYTAINTGREDLRFGETSTQDLSDLVFAFDDTFYNGSFLSLKDQIIEQFLKKSLVIRAGDIRRTLDMTLALTTQQLTGDSPFKDLSKAYEATSPESSPKPASTTEIIKGGFSLNTGEDENDDNYDPNSCPDLVIEGLRVLKKNKNYVTIEYTLINKGLGPANIHGKSKKGIDDNVAFKAMMSSSPKLSRGDIVVGGGFVSNLPKGNKGLLDPAESFTGSIKLEIRKMTRFTPYIILELDTYQNVRECDETNNKNFVKVR